MLGVIKKYLFDKKDDCYQIVVVKDYVITNWGHKGLYFLNKDFSLLDKLFIEENIVIDRIFCEFNKARIALYCPENEALFIINVSTKEVKKIVISKGLELDEGCLSSLYYWRDSVFVVRSHSNQYFSISIEDNKVEAQLQDYIDSECPDFYKFILKIKELGTSIEVVTIFPELGQLTYKNISKKEIGFIDYKTNVHIITAYENDDIHDIYFANKKFIIIRCNIIESIIEKVKDVIIHANKSCEFRRSVYDISLNTIYVMSRYWKESDMQMTLYSLKL